MLIDDTSFLRRAPDITFCLRSMYVDSFQTAHVCLATRKCFFVCFPTSTQTSCMLFYLIESAFRAHATHTHTDLSGHCDYRGGGCAVAELHLPVHTHEGQPSSLWNQTRLLGGKGQDRKLK